MKKTKNAGEDKALLRKQVLAKVLGDAVGKSAGAEADSDKDTKEPKQPETPKGDAEKKRPRTKPTTPSLSVACPCSPTVSKPPKML